MQTSPLQDIVALYSGEQILANNGPVKVFGLIVYTEGDAFLIKCLRDPDYWAALNAVSGEKWAIFSVRPRAGAYELPPTPKSGLGYLVPIWKEPADNKKLLELLDIPSTKDLPLFFVLYLDQQGELIVSAIKIKGENPEATYSNLRAMIMELTEVIERVKEENHANTEAIFTLMKNKVESLKFFEKAKGGLNTWKEIKDLFL